MSLGPTTAIIDRNICVNLSSQESAGGDHYMIVDFGIVDYLKIVGSDFAKDRVSV